MRGVFEEARKDKKMECFVMPIPYYFKDGLASALVEKEETSSDISKLLRT